MSQGKSSPSRLSLGSLVKNALFLLETRAPDLNRLLVKIRAQFKFIDRYRTRRAIDKLVKAQHDHLELEIKEFDRWVAAFRQYLAVEPRNLPIFQSFMTCQLELVEAGHMTHTDPHTPIALCVAKNDLRRLQMVVEHHRQLGIQHFVVLDNDSTDGSREWLVQQPDIDTFLVRQKFQSLVKYGWINRLIAHYGLNRWYLYLDSDELLVYPGCEQVDLLQLPRILEHKQHDRLAALMLDMYSAKTLYSLTDPVQPLQEQYNFFDSQSYDLTVGKRGPIIKGGPRKRVFSEKSEDSPLLIKYPLFKAMPGTIFESAHYLYPYQQTRRIEAAILHYKFLDSDLQRHEQIAREGNFQGGSREYKRYLSTYRDQQNLTFIGEGSVRYVDSSSLQHVSLIKSTAVLPEAKA